MEQSPSSPMPKGAAKGSAACPCGPGTCTVHYSGKKGSLTYRATPLAGFVAGAIAATLILLPWLYFLGSFCPRPVETMRFVTPDVPDAPADTQAP